MKLEMACCGGWNGICGIGIGVLPTLTGRFDVAHMSQSKQQITGSGDSTIYYDSLGKGQSSGVAVDSESDRRKF